RRPHLGVDYGAPTGTPVLASASGAVIFRGREGGYGLLVKIRHPNGYVTSYAHLSRIDVQRGQKVSQGEQIGRVGATGLATGPHLDYRVQDKSGRFINPQNVLALPSDKPVAKEYVSLFTSVRDEYMQRLDSIPEIAPFLNRISHAD
ncbi:MAG: M23 family metallopeptidase, partial [Acidobacteria bacterium]|nr:M23 family metallopeptidase [Acidobacteriota bacterium]